MNEAARAKARTLGLVLLCMSFVELAWVAFCLFGGVVLGLVGLADEQFQGIGLLGGGVYAFMALLNLPIALLQGAAGVQLRRGKGLILTLAALAATVASLLLALYCFPFALGVLIYGAIVLSDAEVRKLLDGSEG